MHLPELEYDWTKTIYGNVIEEIPKDAPEPLGKSVTTTTLLDANLLHELITGRYVATVSTSSTSLLEIGTPTDKHQLRMQPMAQSLLLPRLLLNKLLTLGKLSGT